MTNIKNQPIDAVIIEGVVEIIIDNTVYGWASDSESGLKLEIILDGHVIGHGAAINERKDLLTRARPAKGYIIKTTTAISPEMLVDGRLRIVASLNGETKDLPVWGPLLEAGRLSKIDFEKIQIGWKSIPQKTKEAIGNAMSPLFGGRAFNRTSLDGVVQVGRNGHYFLCAGSNHLSKLYSGEVKVDTNQWIECFKSRQAVIESQGIKYIQITIPEKSSVLHEYVPFMATPGSKAYLELTSKCKEKGIPLFDGLPHFLNSKDRKKCYPQVDTHFSTEGAEIFIQSFLDYINEPVIYTPSEQNWVLVEGDLGSRFKLDGDIRELILRYPALFHNGVTSSPLLKSQFDPDSGHQGRRRVWKNDNALIDKKVICFGNSFFERGLASSQLSWWFSHLFSEFHFIWSADMEIDYIKDVQPDLVVCQTIERFLTIPPSR